MTRAAVTPINQAERLDQGLAALGLGLTALQRQHLLGYLALLNKWNAAYNLTAVRDPDAMVTRHLLDGLSIAPWIHSHRLLDVGTGAGLPGLLMAICYPETAVTLLDSNGKKTRFLVQVAAELKLSNVTVVKSRVESLRNDQSQAFDQITCRAFASLTDFVAGVQALVTPQTELLAMKGAHPDAEMAALPIGFHVSQVIKLAVPGLLEARHLVIVKPGAMVTKADQHVSS